MQECEEMWSILPRCQRVVELHGLKIDRPLDAALLKEYDHWWHVGAVPDMMDINKIHAISMDGHEKVMTRCLRQSSSQEWSTTQGWPCQDVP